MKKLFYKLLLTLVLLSLALPFILKGPDGRPFLTLATTGQDLSALSSDIKNTLLSSFEKFEETVESNNVNNEQEQLQTTTLYRWQDARGRWHFSNRPSENSLSFQVTPNSSIRTSHQTSPAESNENTGTLQPARPSDRQREDFPQSLSTKQAMKILEDAKNSQKLMDNRTGQLNDAIRQAAQ